MGILQPDIPVGRMANEHKTKLNDALVRILSRFLTPATIPMSGAHDSYYRNCLKKAQGLKGHLFSRRVGPPEGRALGRALASGSFDAVHEPSIGRRERRLLTRQLNYVWGATVPAAATARPLRVHWFHRSRQLHRRHTRWRGGRAGGRGLEKQPTQDRQHLVPHWGAAAAAQPVAPLVPTCEVSA